MTRKQGEKTDNKFERREYIKGVIESLGLWNLNRSHTELAKKYNVSRATINNDIDAVMKGMTEKDINKIKLNADIALTKAMAEAQKILSSGSNKERLDAARTVVTIEKGTREMLEGYGRKPKVAEEANVHADFLKKLEECTVTRVITKEKKEAKDGKEQPQ